MTADGTDESGTVQIMCKSLSDCYFRREASTKVISNALSASFQRLDQPANHRRFAVTSASASPSSRYSHPASAQALAADTLYL